MTAPVKIPLTSGRFALVDAADAHLLIGSWYEARRGRTSYAVRTTYRGDGTRTREYMHRVVTGGAWVEVDHINGDGLDNRRDNLRPANREQQTRNTRKKAGNSCGGTPTSSYKGVDLHAASCLWRARIRTGGGRVVPLGYYADERVAAEAYDAAARKYHGEYATLNFPQPGERGAA